MAKISKQEMINVIKDNNVIDAQRVINGNKAVTYLYENIHEEEITLDKETGTNLFVHFSTFQGYEYEKVDKIFKWGDEIILHNEAYDLHCNVMLTFPDDCINIVSYLLDNGYIQ